MSRRDHGVLLVLIAAVLAGLAWLPHLASPYQGPRTWVGAPRFNADRAWTGLVTLATRFPRRWSGSSDRAAAAQWLASSLAGAGLDVSRISFPVALGEARPVMLENVWGVSRGADRADEIIVAVGNYDMAPTSVQAASDTAGHVGTLLELARVIHAAPHRRTFVFLFPDGEEWGMLGARHFAQTFSARAQIAAALSIEDLDAGRLRALGIDGIGQFKGFAPMWLRALAADAAGREAVPVEEGAPLVEWLQRSVLVSATDQGPFLGAGIPAIDLAGRGADRALQDRIYHLPGDTVDHMRQDSLAAYGRIQERILRALDLMPAIPREPDAYLRLGPDRVVGRTPLLAVQIAVFVPLLAAVWFRARRSALSPAMLIREALAIGAVLCVLVIGMVTAKVLPKIGMMPDFELYPPPPRHPMLMQPSWPAIAITLLAMAGTTWLVSRVRHARRAVWPLARALPARRAAPGRPSEGSEAHAAVAASLVWLLVLAVAALLDNPFDAVTFLLLPVVFWTWLEPGRSGPRRAANAALLGLGLLPIVALIARYAQTLQLGPYILWYLFMSIAYGQFSLVRIVLAFATIAVGVRLFTVTVAPWPRSVSPG